MIQCFRINYLLIKEREEVELEIPKDNYNALDNIFWAYLKIKETSIFYPQMLLNKKVIFKIKGHNIKKRNTPKSLAELTSTVNIGDIELFDIDEEHIRNRLAALNHSIFSQLAFLENFIFDSITETRATGHLQQSIMIGTNRIISRINTFTINYNPVATLSRVVPIRNLEHLETNCRHSIFEQLKNLNPLIIRNALVKEILEIKQTSAIVSLYDSVYYNEKTYIINDNKPFEVNFNADKFILSSLTTTTDLGELPNNHAETIKRAFLNYNLHIRESDISHIDVFNEYFAVIYGNLCEEKIVVSFRISKKKAIFNIIKKFITKKDKTNSEYHFLNQANEQSSLDHNKNLDINLIEHDNNFTKLTSMVEQGSEKETINNLQNIENLLTNISMKAFLLPDTNVPLMIIDLKNTFNNQTNKQNRKIVEQYNLISKEDKQQRLDAINEHYQSLPDDEQKKFKEKIKKVGTTAYAAGINIEHNDKDPGVIASTLISGGGLLGVSKLTGISPIKSLTKATNYLKNMVSSPQISTTAAGETVELTPLLSAGETVELTAAETLTTEATVSAVSEGSIIGTEAAFSASLAPETLGLSLIIGGLVLAGTGLFYWIFGSNQTTVVKHESHNQYNEIEKYYQFLAHDKLKLSIDSVKWKTISEIYQKYFSNYQEFVKKIKEKITGFHKEDHSGWGGKLDDSDINILIKVLFDNFHIINNSFLTNSTHGWKIVTNTIGSYFQLEIE